MPSLNLSNLHYDIPGASIQLAGIYSLDGAKFNFTGTADMQATVSRMVGGWKGLLLMPVDKILSEERSRHRGAIQDRRNQIRPSFRLDFDRRKKENKASAMPSVARTTCNSIWYHPLIQLRRKNPAVHDG